MAEITNPIKKMPKGTLIIAGVAGAGALVYVWWKKKNASATTPPAPASGYGYGAYGYSSGYGYGVSPIFGYGQGGFPFMGGGGYGSTTGYGYQSQFPAPTTNAQWFQEAISWMSQGGTSVVTAEAALAKYLAGAAVTSDQALLIQEAEGALGPPPVSGPGGYPPNINSSSSSGGGHAKNPVTGLKISKPGTTGADISWNASSGATSYKVTATKGSATMIGPTSARIHNINTGRDRGDQSTVTVLAEPASPNARAATIVVHTKR
jgi:hypothetical protein